MRSVWYKLKSLRTSFRKLNISELKGVTDRIAQSKSDLHDVQAKLILHYSDQLVTEEKTLLEKLEKWSLIEESILQQISRATWIKLRDSNTKYFSTVMKDRNHKKTISMPIALDVTLLTENRKIQIEIITFYKSLMGKACTTLPIVNIQTMRLGLVLNHAQQLDLCANVTDQEIYAGLCSIGDDKAPGVDGYNALFFKRAWLVIKMEICEAVKNSFVTGKLFRAILATRLQKVMPLIISDTQASFIPGRKVADNVLLAHELVKAYSRKNTSPRCVTKVDIQKAYDIVDWNFSHQVIVCLRFPDRFTSWIMTCVSTVNYSIIVNGEHTKQFDAVRGLMQGDPVSQFL
ncbi:uncharacterized protein LOC132627048 [Lycium barbarum]|uniref:uncharacterized protein LOC132627048 n=1 Tax=Lycium barbarum TaxID=112863 RepID=UPI00293E8746|nr:uncharacterized protein LOC132627048 [Lycium barbarum]